jgi:hypothetical protein
MKILIKTLKHATVSTYGSHIPAGIIVKAEYKGDGSDLIKCSHHTYGVFYTEFHKLG